MSKSVIDTPVLPRPVEPLPDYADLRARKSLVDRIIDSFALSRGAATAIANAVVDPSAVRKGIGGDVEPVAERIAVPGGTILGIRTQIWSHKVIPDPRNPRTLPARKHPFAVAPGTGKEDTRFRPLSEPRTPVGTRPTAAELAVEIENRHHLTWASQLAAEYVRATNDWSESIRTQGVMEAVWLVPTTYQIADGTEPATVLVTAEGSSRVTAVHQILSIKTADIPFDDADGKFRVNVRRLNEALRSGTAEAEDLVTLRCSRIPALVIVGFVPHASGATGFPTALKSLVALRHVDPPTPWGEGPENESLADEVLDEMERRGLISAIEAAYYAGSLTKEEARSAHLPGEADTRAARIVRLFSNPDPRVREAIRIAVTSQSTRKNVNQGLLNALATALILRAVIDDPARMDQIRRYLRKAYGKAVHSAGWDPTGRDTETLIQEALAEVRAAASGRSDAPGPSTLELAVRSAFPLVVAGRLSGDRGTAGNAQPDRRTPGEVLDTMRHSPHGVLQLGQALRDHAAGHPIRIVDDEGRTVEDDEGSHKVVTDTFLRGEFPPAGKRKAHVSGNTPTDRYRNAVGEFASAIDGLQYSFEALRRVEDDDGGSLVDRKGVDGRDCEAWREIMRRIDEELVFWSRTHRRINGVSPRPEPEPVEEVDDFEEDSEDATAAE